MSIELNQQLQPAMQVKVTPKQIAANYILQMSSMALQEAISQELDENPALEMLETSACPICGSPVTGNYCTECMPRKESTNDETVAAADELPSDGRPACATRRTSSIRSPAPRPSSRSTSTSRGTCTPSCRATCTMSPTT